MNLPFSPIPKPTYKRRKPKRGNHTKITDKVTQEVLRRSGGVCERCNDKHPKAWGYQRAHLINASQLGSGKEPWNIALLCGPSTQTGTCHHWADSTKAGREWRKDFRDRLIKYYGGI